MRTWKCSTAVDSSSSKIEKEREKKIKIILTQFWANIWSRRKKIDKKNFCLIIIDFRCFSLSRACRKAQARKSSISKPIFFRQQVEKKSKTIDWGWTPFELQPRRQDGGPQLRGDVSQFRKTAAPKDILVPVFYLVPIFCFWKKFSERRWPLEEERVCPSRMESVQRMQ